MFFICVKDRHRSFFSSVQADQGLCFCYLGSIICLVYMSRVVRKPVMCICENKDADQLRVYAKTKTQISFAVTAKLISVFVFATRIVQSLYFLNTKFQAPSHLLWLYSPVCVGPGRKPRRPVFSERGSYPNFKPLASISG